jgi:hypothetical protein
VNKTRVDGLLSEWGFVVEDIAKQSLKKAMSFENGPNTRIHRTKGPPVVFDMVSTNKQKEIQKSLSKELPDLIDLINSEPALQGHAWTVSDYVELCVEHYSLVIQKIREAMQRER